MRSQIETMASQRIATKVAAAAAFLLFLAVSRSDRRRPEVCLSCATVPQRRSASSSQLRRQESRFLKGGDGNAHRQLQQEIGAFSLGALSGFGLGNGGGAGAGTVMGNNQSQGIGLGIGDGFGTIGITGSATPGNSDANGVSETNVTTVSLSSSSGRSSVISGGRGSGNATNLGIAQSGAMGNTGVQTNIGDLEAGSNVSSAGIAQNTANSTGGWDSPAVATGTSLGGGASFGTIAGFLSGGTIISTPTIP